MIEPRDDMLDDMMSDDDEMDSSYNSYDADFNEPSIGSDDPYGDDEQEENEDEYSAGFLSTIWEEHTQGDCTTVGSNVSSHKATAPLHNSRSGAGFNESFFHDSANRDLYGDDSSSRGFWKSNSDSFATGEVPAYTSEDEFSLESLDSGNKIKPAKRWSSDMSFGSMSISSGSSGGGVIKEDEEEDVLRDAPPSRYDDMPTTAEAALDQVGSRDSFTMQSKDFLAMGRDALLAQLMEAYMKEGGGESSTTQQQQKSRPSLDTYLSSNSAHEVRSGAASGGAARGGSSSKRNQPPGLPVRRFSMDSMSSEGANTAISGDSLADRLARMPDANAFNADEQDGKNDTPPVVSRKRQEGRKTPPGLPVRQSSFNLEGDAESESGNNNDSVDGNASAASFRTNGKTKRRSSHLSASSAEMTIEEGDETAISSDDDTLESDVGDDKEDQDIIPQARQYLAPLKGGSHGDSGNEEEKNTPHRTYLAASKGSFDEQDMDAARQYLDPLKSNGGDDESTVPSNDDSSPMEETPDDQPIDQEEEERSSMPSVPVGSIPKITAIPIPPAEERVDASFVLENHLLKERQGFQSPGGAMVQRRCSGGNKRKIKYDMARSAISPKIDRLLSPQGRVAPDRQHDDTNDDGTPAKPRSCPELSIPPVDAADGRPPSSSSSLPVEDPTSDPELSPLQKKPIVVSMRRSTSNTNMNRLRIRNMSSVGGLLLADDDVSDTFVEKERSYSSTQLTEASSTFLSESSEMEMTEATNLLLISHNNINNNCSNHSRSRSTRMTMAGTLDESEHSYHSIMRQSQAIKSPRSPDSPLQHPNVLDLDASDRSTNSSAKNAKRALKKGLARGKRRLQNLFRPMATSDDDHSESDFSFQ